MEVSYLSLRYYLWNEMQNDVVPEEVERLTRYRNSGRTMDNDVQSQSVQRENNGPN